MNVANQKTMPVVWQNIETACLDISLNNKYQTGKYLESLFVWTSKRFKSCVISVGDTLHRHNIILECNNPFTAHKISREMGDRWLEEALSRIQHLTIPYKVMRSDDWLAHNRFAITHDALWDFYRQDRLFQCAANGDIEKFVLRHDEKNMESARQSSLAYLMEETAADIVLAQDMPTTHIYPGAWHQCYFNLMGRAHEIPPLLRGLENSAFKRISPAQTAKKAANMNKDPTYSALADAI